MSAKPRRVAGVGVLAAVVLVAGGGTSAIAAKARTAGAHQVAIAANTTGLLKFTKSSITTSPGKVTIVFTNKSPLAHDVVLVNSKNKVVGKTPVFDHGTKSFTVTLSAGKYTYYCSVPGHRQAGMQGTLTVT
jgi:plastocyanin